MALVCPSCTANNPNKNLYCKKCGAGLIDAVRVPDNSIITPRNIAIALLVVVAVAWATGLLRPNAAGTAANGGNRMQSLLAYERCKEAVEGQLVAPQTAQFADYGGVIVEKEGRIHRFTGQVDSENRLGVPLRLTFTCAIEENEEGAFRVNSAAVAEP